MLVIAVSLFVILLVAGGVVAVVASSSREAADHPLAQRVRNALPTLPVIREDEDVHLRR
ncbi:hypothetical protein RDV89_12500 [Nocardioides zeae]|uniref:Uncharacterized protein n=1 Tax=Nocardioides imazamoxiresistens TaxID=3231893 RepID=A0ABU3PYP1_9ACTN|nr:hypothetical protein [Nocardioides zeae]